MRSPLSLIWPAVSTHDQSCQNRKLLTITPAELFVAAWRESRCVRSPAGARREFRLEAGLDPRHFRRVSAQWRLKEVPPLTIVAWRSAERCSKAVRVKAVRCPRGPDRHQANPPPGVQRLSVERLDRTVDSPSTSRKRVFRRGTRGAKGPKRGATRRASAPSWQPPCRPDRSADAIRRLWPSLAMANQMNGRQKR